MAIYLNRNAPSSGIASILALQGRGGDTELVHMTKPEVKRLQQTGLMSINPDTGLPEYFLGGIFDTVKSAVKNIFKPENIIPAVASIALPAIAGPSFAGVFGLSPLATRSILSGAGTALGSLPFRKPSDALSAGIISGGLQFGTGKLRQALGPTDADLGIDSDSARSKAIAMKQRESLARQAAKEGLIQGPPNATIGGPMLDEEVVFDLSPQVTNIENITTSELNKLLPPSSQKNILTAQQVQQQFPKRLEDLQKRGSLQESDISFIERMGTSTPEQQARLLGNQGQFISEAALKGKEFPDRFSAARKTFNFDDPNTYLDAAKEFGSELDFGDVGRGLASVEATSLVDAIEAQRLAEEKAINDLIQQGIPAPVARRRVIQRRAPGEFGTGGSGLTAEEARRRAVQGGGFQFFGDTTLVPAQAASGGIVGLAEGGRPDFEGIVGGEGHGMEDNQIMDIKGGGLLAVSPKEYVVPADVMAMIGNGNPDDGADDMDEFIAEFRQKKYGRAKQPPEMDGRTALQSLMS